jgi:hypothetical protein
MLGTSAGAARSDKLGPGTQRHIQRAARGALLRVWALAGVFFACCLLTRGFVPQRRLRLYPAQGDAFMLGLLKSIRGQLQQRSTTSK